MTAALGKTRSCFQDRDPLSLPVRERNAVPPALLPLVGVLPVTGLRHFSQRSRWHPQGRGRERIPPGSRGQLHNLDGNRLKLVTMLHSARSNHQGLETSTDYYVFRNSLEFEHFAEHEDFFLCAYYIVGLEFSYTCASVIIQLGLTWKLSAAISRDLAVTADQMDRQDEILKDFDFFPLTFASKSLDCKSGNAT
jgi:hypothetical protein